MAEVTLNVNDVDEGSSVSKQIKAGTGEGKPPVGDEGTPPGTPKEGENPPGSPPAEEGKPPVGTSSNEGTPPGTSAGQPPLEDVLEYVFGRKVNKDDAKKVVENLPGILKEFEDIKANSPKFANELIKGINDYVAKGGDIQTYLKIQALDFDKLDGLEAIKAQYKWEHPQLTDAQIEKKLNKIYKQSEDATDDEKEDAAIEIAIDGKKAKEFLLKVKQEKSVPEPERLRQEEEKAESKRLSDWSPVTKNLVKDFNKFDIPLSFDQDGKETEFLSFSDINENLKKELEQDLNLIIEESGIPFNQESASEIGSLLKDRFILRNFKNILRSALTEKETRVKKKVLDEYQNSSPPPKGDKKIESSRKTNEDDLFEKQMKELQGN